MRIRLEGTRAEVDAAVTALASGFEIQEVSGFYPNRGPSVLGRIYVTATVRPAPTVRARSTRLDTDPPASLTS